MDKKNILQENDPLLSQQLDAWAKEWEQCLAGICRLFTGEVRERTLDELKDELHNELIELANETPFSGHDLAETLLFLLEKGYIYGRLGKVILEYTHEWVLPCMRDNVLDLFLHVSFLANQGRLSGSKINN